MDITQETKRKYLQSLLDELGKYHGAYAHFSRLLGKATGIAYHRNFVNRVLADEIKFERSLHEYIDAAIVLAQQLLHKYDEARQHYLATIPLRQIIDTKASANLLHEQILRIDHDAESGAYAQGELGIGILSEIVDFEKLRKASPYHEGLLYLVASKIKLQLGRGREGLALARPAATIFRELGEHALCQKVYSLQGNLLRQAGDYGGAMVAFKANAAYLDAHPHVWPQREMLLVQNRHQQAVTLMREGHALQDTPRLATASALFRETNEFFEDNAPEPWTTHARIREAEAAVKLGDLQRAEVFLSDYENLHRVSLLRDPQKVILLRILAEFHFKSGDASAALPYAQTATALARRERYEHELEQLEQLLDTYAREEKLKIIPPSLSF